MDIDHLIEHVTAHAGPADILEVRELLGSACRIAAKAHSDFRRIDGEPFLNHPLHVAHMLAEWHAPPRVVAVGLLHDLNNLDYSKGYPLDLLVNELGSETHELLQTSMHLNSTFRRIEMELSVNNGYDINYYVDSIMHTGRDAIVIKIADRLHNLKTISSLTRDFQERAARVGINLLVPLTDRLGMADVRHQLENYSFAVMHAKYYEMFERHYTSHSQEMEKIRGQLQEVLVKTIASVKVEWLPFSLYNLYCHHVEQNTKLGRPIHADLPSLKPLDMGSLLVILQEEDDCYRALGALHKAYTPLEGQFRDFIGSPEENGYRALHTQVQHPSGSAMQVFIRTQQMDLVARKGISARWMGIPEELLPQLPEEAKLPSSKLQVFTPSGEPKYFPHGATLLDFAYEIHTEVGHRCIGAIVNGEEIDDFYQPLRPGSTIEIKLGGAEVEPRLDALDHVHTSHAVDRIRTWLTHNRHQAMLERGRALLARELQQQGMHTQDAYIQKLLKQIAQNEQMKSLDDLFVAIGVGRQKASRVVVQIRLMRSAAHGNTEADIWPAVRVGALAPQENALPQLVARCCRPLPLDDVVGYHRKRDQVLVIHKRSCSQIKRTKGLVPVKWEEPKEVNYVVAVEAVNRQGLVADLSRAVQRQACDMLDYSVARRADGFLTEAHIYLGKTTMAQRARLKKDLERVPYVISVEVILSPRPPYAAQRHAASSISAPDSARRSLRGGSERPAGSQQQRIPEIESGMWSSNPYGPRPALGERFYGRESEFQRISALVQKQSESAAILLWGQKRIGKSSLLINFNERFRGSLLSIFIDVQSMQEASTTHFLYHLVTRIAEVVNAQLRDGEAKIVVPELKRVRKEILSFFDAFMQRTQKVAHEHPLVIILDEFQCLRSLREEQVSREAIFSRLRSYSQHGQRVHLIFSGGGLISQLSDQIGLAGLFSSVNDEKLDCLEMGAATRLIKDGLSQVGIIEDEAVEYLLQLTSGHPFYLQLLCRRLYDQVQQQRIILTQKLVAGYVHEWVIRADASRFQHLWEASDDQCMQQNKLLVSAIAHFTREQNRIDYEDLRRIVSPHMQESNLIEALKDLSELGVIKQDGLSYALAVELFAHWLRQHLPFQLLSKETAVK